MATPALLQSKTTSSGGNVTTFSVAFTSNIAASTSTLFCFAFAARAPTASLTVADDTNAGNYTLDVVTDGTGQNSVCLARKSSVSAGGKPNVTITSTISAPIYVVLQEWSNLDPAPFDQSAWRTLTGAPTSKSSTATGALAGSGELVLGYLANYQNYTSVTAGSGYTLDPTGFATNYRSIAEYLISADTSAQNATFTTVSGSAYDCLVATYKPSGFVAGGGTKGFALMGVGS